MFLSLRNIGKIAEADIELNGITVIAGENDTGKSTIGKVLFCIFNAFYKLDERIAKEVEDKILENIQQIIRQNNFNGVVGARLLSIGYKLAENKSQYIQNHKALNNVLREWLQVGHVFEEIAVDQLQKDIENRILDLLAITEDEIFHMVIQKRFKNEFGGQLNNIYDKDKKGIIGLKIKSIDTQLIIEEDMVRQIEKIFGLDTEAIYIDNPFILEDLKNFNTNNTRNEHLKAKLRNLDSGLEVEEVLNEIMTKKKLEKIFGKINTVCRGDLVHQNHIEYVYKINSTDLGVDIRNISTGLKTFTIIKTLLLNGSLQENGVLILDEPEIHLHPAWQLVFAELIVLLQKEFKMHILLNTHSPYFLRAIQVYSAKHEIADTCKYYLSENDGNKAIVRDVTTQIDEIYDKLARPLELLENERLQDA